MNKISRHTMRKSVTCSEETYNIEDIESIIKSLKLEWVKKGHDGEVLNLALSFDIETSSFYEKGEKRSCMYIWMLCIKDKVVIGRTWDEFKKAYDELVRVLELSKRKRAYIYVHNLSYEFQWIRKMFEWGNVFALDERKVCYARTVDGIEFRCSYILSGYSLAKLSDQLIKHDIRKKVGDLDYSLIRHSGTSLTSREMGYCINDVLVVCAYIEEKIEIDGNITKIPLTKTSYVRRFCRNNCLYDKGKEKSHRNMTRKFSNYRRLMSLLTMSVETYKMLKRAFQGGFTHTGFLNAGKIFRNVHSCDFTSSYPYVLVAEKGFPMGEEKRLDNPTREDLEYKLKYYCCLFDVEFTNLQSKEMYEDYISISKCWIRDNVVANNGRVYSADRICTTITEQDFAIIQRFYTWDNMRVANFRYWQRGYLPTDFVASILDLYVKKTTLKGIEGKEAEYLNSKEMVNATYGMSVTDPCRDDINYIFDEWLISHNDIAELIEKYNKSIGRFTSYNWGIWCTALARKNLFTAIYELKEDFIYADTDSVKFLNYEKHEKYFREYNEKVMKKLKMAMDYHGLSMDMCVPKTIKGVEKPLGVWDYEGCYQLFKALRAKAYMYLENYELHITIAGLGKKAGAKYLTEKYGKYGAFKAFDDGLYIPPDRTGKNTHTYIDEETNGIVTDYLGNDMEYKELSSIHLEGTEYSLSLADDFVRFLNMVRYIY